MRKTLIALGTALVATAALAGDQPRQLLVGDDVWLRSSACSVPDSVPTDGRGFDVTDQCELERLLKERLRKGPVDLTPASDRGI